MDERLADIGIGLPGQAREPGFDRVHPLADAGEAEPVDDPLDRADLVLDAGAILVGDGDRRGEVAEGDMVAAQRLECQIGVGGLVVGIAVEQLDRLVVDHLAQHRGDRLALVEPLAAQPGQGPGRVGLVERDEPRDPAIAEVLVVELIEDARPAEAGEAEDGERTQVQRAQHRLEAPGQRRVREQPVEIHRRLGHAHALASRRDRAVEESPRLRIVERCDLRHEAREQVERAIGLRDEPGQRLAPVATLQRIDTLDQRAAGAVRLVGRRQEGQGEMVAALEMLARIFEAGAALLVDQP